MERKLFLDTNALLNLQENAFKEEFVIAQKTLEELENIKSSGSKDGEVKYKARKVAHLLDDNWGKYHVVKYSPDIDQTIESFNLDKTPDNIILASAYIYNSMCNILVVSDDLNCKFISREIFGLETRGANEINLVKDMDEYLGYKDVTLSDEEMSDFYLHLDRNTFNNVVNEYLIIRKSDGEIVDYRKWTGCEYKNISYKQISSQFLGKIKPRNPEQVLAFDMLQDKNITINVLPACFGSGTTISLISNALTRVGAGK